MLLGSLFAVFFIAASARFTANITVEDTARGREVTAVVCHTDSAAAIAAGKLDLYVFAHGGGLFAADYSYLCDDLPSTHVVARLGSLPSDDPMDLNLMAGDIDFLAKALPQQSSSNATSPLFKLLSGRVVLAGHSMGAAAALLAGMTPNDNVIAVGALAPGFWGETQASLLKGIGSRRSSICGRPTLVVVGDQDCANSLNLQALPVWSNLTASCGDSNASTRALAVLRGATHCQWTNPVQGSCTFDTPCPPQQRLERARQQQLGTSLLRALSAASLNVDLREMRVNGSLTYVDASSSTSEVSNLHSFCPCGSSSTGSVQWV